MAEATVARRREVLTTSAAGAAAAALAPVRMVPAAAGATAVAAAALATALPLAREGGAAIWERITSILMNPELHRDTASRVETVRALQLAIGAAEAPRIAAQMLEALMIDGAIEDPEAARAFLRELGSLD